LTLVVCAGASVRSTSIAEIPLITRSFIASSPFF
jgi:hypothetical protein